MRTILGLVLVALLLAVGCSDPQAGEPVWYGIVYDANGCIVDPGAPRRLFGDRFGENGSMTLEECIGYGEEIVSEFEADGYRCGRGCTRTEGEPFCGGGWWIDQALACDATVEVIVP